MNKAALMLTLLTSCVAAPDPEPDPKPGEAAQPPPAAAAEKKPAGYTEEEIDRIGREFSTKFTEFNRSRGERYRLAVLEGRARDACKLNNSFILESQQLCRDAPVPFSGCWDVMAKSLSDCSGLDNNPQE